MRKQIDGLVNTTQKIAVPRFGLARGGAACAKVCPTESIRFGPLTEMRNAASRRVADLHLQGYDDARLYDSSDTSVKSIHALFVLLGEPENYRLPPRPEVPTIYLKDAYGSTLATAALAAALVLSLFLFL